MADLAVGDVVSSALDRAYQQYSIWCQQLGYSPASYERWRQIDRYGVSNWSLATGQTVGLVSYAQSRRRIAALPQAE